MRIYLTGGSGFVGSNFTRVFEAHGADVIAPRHDDVDLTDAGLVRRSVAATRPDAIVHTAIWNDFAGLVRDRRRAWAEYVDATRNVVKAANGSDAQVVLVSTDWVFDGTQGPADEAEPPNPINAYGFLKAASELVVTESVRDRRQEHRPALDPPLLRRREQSVGVASRGEREVVDEGPLVAGDSFGPGARAARRLRHASDRRSPPVSSSGARSSGAPRESCTAAAASTQTV